MYMDISPFNLQSFSGKFYEHSEYIFLRLLKSIKGQDFLGLFLNFMSRVRFK